MLASRDMLCGVIGLALAASYYALADALPVSLLSDEIGADGVPKSLAVGLALCSLLLIGRAALVRGAPSGDGSSSALDHARSLGIIVLGALYAALAPVIGYVPALALLLAATALYFGAGFSLRLVLVSTLGAGLFWAMFAKMLGVAMPQGSLLRLLM
jgi:putative tricarboxylic transport membrane protein